MQHISWKLDEKVPQSDSLASDAAHQMPVLKLPQIIRRTHGLDFTRSALFTRAFGTRTSSTAGIGLPRGTAGT